MNPRPTDLDDLVRVVVLATDPGQGLAIRPPVVSAAQLRARADARPARAPHEQRGVRDRGRGRVSFDTTGGPSQIREASLPGDARPPQAPTWRRGRLGPFDRADQYVAGHLLMPLAAGRHFPVRQQRGGAARGVYPERRTGFVMPRPARFRVLSVRGLWLAYLMRLLRQQCGLSLEDVAGYLGTGLSSLARLERCEWPLRADVVTALLNLYGVYEQDLRTSLEDLARDSGCLHWWQLDPLPEQPSGPLAAATRSPVGQARLASPPSLDWLYGQATQVSVYGPTHVPELLQTRGYGLAIATQTVDPGAAAHEPHRRVEIVAHRRQQLTARTVRLTAIIDGLVLHRSVGGIGVLGEQLDHLRDLTAPDTPPTVTVRILPTDRDRLPANSGPFTVLRLGHAFPPVAVIEHLGGHLLIEGPWAARYVSILDQLTKAALTPTASHTAITARATDLAGQLAPAAAGGRR